jgi:modulator of FtsH protease
MAVWSNFFIAQVGASAALPGLVLVGVSLNLSRIISYPGLPNIAIESLVLLLLLLITASVALVPDQPAAILGIEILVGALIEWVSVLTLLRSRLRQMPKEHFRPSLALGLLTNIAVLSLVIGGIILLTGNIAGLYGFIPGMAVTYLTVFLNAWGLLVEINR